MYVPKLVQYMRWGEGLTERENYAKILRRRRMLEMRRKRRQRKRRIEAVLYMSLLVFSLCVIVLIATKHYEQEDVKKPDYMLPVPFKTVKEAVEESLVVTTPEAAEVSQEVSVRIGSVGDVILHLPIVEAYAGDSAGEYDFTPAFETFRQAYESVDFMVANLETSFGDDEKPYSGFPNFNSPDEIVANLQSVGVDLQLLANNHIYDNEKDGFLRTISVLQQAGANYTGVRVSEEEPRYFIRNINGIQIGFVNYTYEMENDGERKLINGNIMDKSVENLLNSYEGSDLNSFYKEMEQITKEMRSIGTEFVIVYMHWGNEYEMDANELQQTIAQKLCDLGVDAVIGGHPHVVQPIEIFTSADGTHKMFCAYSLGNHFSNQRREKISSCPNGHTEDGLMLNLTVSKTEEKVSITGIEAIPTYVYKTEEPKYYVIPIYNVTEVEAQTGLSGIQSSVQASYDRTNGILGNSIEDARRELGIPFN